MKIDYKSFEIEVIDDKNYKLKSTNDLHQYRKVYFKENEYRSSSKHAIIVKEYGIEISSILICETEGATGIHENSFIIEDNKIWILVSNKVYCFEIPSLKIIWQKEFDQFTNFCIYQLEENFVIHGELEIFRITKNGEIIWRFGGRDIWISVDGKDPFNIERDKIRLFDFESNEYVLDFNGNVIEDNPRVIIPKAKRKWWQIFG